MQLVQNNRDSQFYYDSVLSLDDISQDIHEKKGVYDCSPTGVWCTYIAGSCFTRIPYATLIATIMCILGVVTFCATMHRGAGLAVLMFDNVFKIRMFWYEMFKSTASYFIIWIIGRVEAVQMTFVIIGACMAALGLMILTVGCLATGATRYKVYRAWRSRVGGRISCAVVCKINILLKFFLMKFLTVYGNHICVTNSMDFDVLLLNNCNFYFYCFLVNV